MLDPNDIVEFYDSEFKVSLSDGLWGNHLNAKWREYVFSTLIADWACYPKPVDRVDWGRLLFVMDLFPQGFRVWWVKMKNGTEYPVGYSAWYPVSSPYFDLLVKNPQKLTDRFIKPQKECREDSDIYIFNISIIEQLRKTTFSKSLLIKLAEDLTPYQTNRVASITVSPDGVRISKDRFGMKNVGPITIAGESEDVYARFTNT
jgi:hypothetical protein